MSIKLGDIVEIVAYGEICCELCNEIIHNHIDCPVCKKDYAETDAYHEIYFENTVTCECGSIFEKKDEDDWYRGCEAKLIYLK